MRILTVIFTFAFAMLATIQTEAAVSKRASAKKAAAKTKKNKKAQAEESHVSTSHNFEDHGVLGEYQMPDEALAKVENEKSLADLLGVRKHFKDRLAEANEQE